MRLYGRRYAKRFVDRRVRRKTETRDAILWDIDWANYEARVKIQGSNEYVIAHFPRNWMRQPYWVKPGNAVRVVHRSGVRGYVEIVGEGRAIPTPVQGGSFPTPSGLPDMILTGCVMSATTPPSMGVNVTSGTFRIDDTVYYLTPGDTGYIVMDVPAPMIMGVGILMGSGVSTIEIEPAPDVSGEFRYDLVCVGTDSVLDYMSGEESISPEKPSVPADHLQIGDYVFVRFGVTEIEQSDIGVEFAAPQATTKTWTFTPIAPATFSGEAFDWCASGPCGSYPNPECFINIRINDQYGEPLTPGAGGHSVTLQLLNGTGSVWSGNSGWNDAQVFQNFIASSYNFKYHRHEDAGEKSVIFIATLSRGVDEDLSTGNFLLLWDDGGQLLPFAT